MFLQQKRCFGISKWFCVQLKTNNQRRPPQSSALPFVGWSPWCDVGPLKAMVGPSGSKPRAFSHMADRHTKIKADVKSYEAADRWVQDLWLTVFSSSFISIFHLLALRAAALCVRLWPWRGGTLTSSRSSDPRRPQTLLPLAPRVFHVMLGHF